MGKVIHKYPLKLNRFNDLQNIQMPENSRILKVDDQDGILTLWALVDTDNPDTRVMFEVVATGQQLSDLGRLKVRHHLNTVVMSDGIVWHVFQILKVSPQA